MRQRLTRLILGGSLFIWMNAPRPLYADDDIIREVEGLRDSLPFKERAHRQALTRRLADLIYNDCLALAAKDITDPKVRAQLSKARARGIRLYEEFIAGDSGRYEPAAGEPREMARFHLARLYADNEQLDQAVALWRELVKLEDYPKIRGEAALSLAEREAAVDPASPRALELYQIAMVGEKNPDSLAYTNYRAAWILRNQGKYSEAIAGFEKSLWDSLGQVKDEVLRDLMVAHSQSSLPVDEVIKYYQSLGEKLNRKDILAGLANAYTAAGNKIAAVAVLTEHTARTTDALAVVRLLEETYGLRDWTRFTESLARADKIDMSKVVGDDDRKEVHRILTRLTVQLDAEKVTRAETTPYFILAVDLFVRLFPADPTMFKMVSGTVAVEPSPETKAQRIVAVLGNPLLSLTQDQRNLLREQLISAYQKLGKHGEASREAATLAQESEKPADRRRFAFVQASELFDNGQEQEALPLFQRLATENPADDMGKKSAMIAVRSLGRANDYASVLATAAAWLSAVAPNTDLKESAEYKSVVEVKERAEFEWAVGQGDKPEALAIFKASCLAKKFEPQSCRNAKSLAVKLKTYDVLMTLLIHEQNYEELANLYEANGYFDKAGEYYEKKRLRARPSTRDFLYVALLYEVAGQASSRNRILEQMVGSLQSGHFATTEEEQLVFRTLKDAGLLGAKLLGLPWSKDMKCSVTNAVAEGAGDQKNLRQALLACDSYAGKNWARAVLNAVDDLNTKQSKIKFYGNASKRRFQQRLQAINQMAAVVDKYLPGADRSTYLVLTERARAAFDGLGREIDLTPIPSEAPAEVIPQIRESLAEMSAPFKERAEAYAKLMQTEQAKPQEEVVQDLAEERPAPVNRTVVDPNLKVLNNDPKNRDALQRIQEAYKQSGQNRVATYFAGRLKQLDTNM